MKTTFKLISKRLPLLLAAGFLLSSLPSFTVSAKDGSFLVADKRKKRDDRRRDARPASRSHARPAAKRNARPAARSHVRPARERAHQPARKEDRRKRRR